MSLHNANKCFLPATLALAVRMRETFENLQLLLQIVLYKELRWDASANVKFVAMLTGLTGGYTKLCCFYCEWDS